MEKQIAREHFTFARQQKRFPREHFTFPRQQKRFPREHFTFAREQKRFPREHFTFARQEKRFPRCRRTGVVFRRSVHSPADPAWPSARVRARVTPKATTLLKIFTKDVFFDPSRLSYG